MELTIDQLQLAKAEFELLCDYRRYLRGEPPADPPADAWAALVAKHEAAGLGRVSAILAAAAERPDLYQAQSIPAAQFRASR